MAIEHNSKENIELPPKPVLEWNEGSEAWCMRTSDNGYIELYEGTGFCLRSGKEDNILLDMSTGINPGLIDQAAIHYLDEQEKLR